MNHKNARIRKLAEQGLSDKQIARKLGLATTERVELGLAWLAEHERFTRPEPKPRVKAIDR